MYVWLQYPSLLSYFVLIRFAGCLLLPGLVLFRWGVWGRLFFFVCLFFMAAPAAYTSSQARGGVGASAASLHLSHSNARYQRRLQPTAQEATPGP